MPTEASWVRFHGGRAIEATQASARWIAYRDYPAMSDASVALSKSATLAIGRQRATLGGYQL
jgi:hypothetical protein